MLLQFSERATLIRGEIKKDQIASGTVCVSGLGFSCSNANIVSDRGPLPEQTVDTVRITREIGL